MNNSFWNFIELLQKRIAQLELAGEYSFASYFELILTYLVEHPKAIRASYNYTIQNITTNLRRKDKTRYKILLGQGINADIICRILDKGLGEINGME